jgi:tetraacyldisaccharide 4'-kinase
MADRPGDAAVGTGLPPAIPVRRDARGRAELRARAAWPGGGAAWLRAATAAYGAAVRTWTFAHEAGLVAPRRGALPTISVGGLTVGGSGKTPLAAEVARLLAASGRCPAVVTRGYEDELALHARLARGWPVVGHPDRLVAIAAAARGGADIVVLDDGFQHRRLVRDLDIVILDADVVGRVPWRLLPSGPFREPPAALERAGAIVITRRAEGGPNSLAVASWARRCTDVPIVARCALEPGELRLVSGSRGRGGPEAPTAAVAVAGVMKPEPFLAAVRAAGLRPRLEVVLPDHGLPAPSLLAEIVEAARDGGLVMTAKDAARLLPRLPPDVEVWCLGERLTWEEGLDELRERIESAAESATGVMQGTGR